MAAADSLGYDETPYPSAPYPYSHPDHLAIVARLFGIAAASAASCRVLEVGCADGANLIPMALALAKSQFVGIDLSERQIAAGRSVIDRLGLTNIELRNQDVAEFAASDSTFDYIIAHGVYSWTSQDVRTKLLALCRSCLTPNGVAFVSYNVYPGWQQQQAIREWLLRATHSAVGTSARLQQVRRLMSGLRGQLRSHGTAAQRAIADTLEHLESWDDSYLRHDLLEDSNQPLYFSEFVDRLEAHGLRFFAEADVASMAGAGLPAELAQSVTRLGGTIVGREQLLDLLSHRAFRQSLLCHAECPARERIDEDAVRAAYVVSTLRQRPGSAGGPARFESRGGFAVDVAESAVAAALAQLQNAWPGGAWFADLIQGPELEDQQQSLVNLLLAGFVERTVELHGVAPAFATSLSERPIASPLARLQAETGNLVTNLRHDPVRLDAVSRKLIHHLDGAHTRDDLQRLFADAANDSAYRPDIDALLNHLLRNSLLLSRATCGQRLASGQF